MSLVATISDSTDIEHCSHHRKFCWTAPAYEICWARVYQLVWESQTGTWSPEQFPAWNFLLHDVPLPINVAVCAGVSQLVAFLSCTQNQEVHAQPWAPPAWLAFSSEHRQTLLPRSQMQQHKETQKNGFPGSAKPRLVCCLMEDVFAFPPTGSPLRITLEYLNLESLGRVSVFPASLLPDRKTSPRKVMWPTRGLAAS